MYSITLLSNIIRTSSFDNEATLSTDLLQFEFLSKITAICIDQKNPEGPIDLKPYVDAWKGTTYFDKFLRLLIQKKDPLTGEVDPHE